jgi:hypothetical protein
MHSTTIKVLNCLIFTLMHFKKLYCTSVFLINFLCNEKTARVANVSSLAERRSLFRSHIKCVCDFCQKSKRHSLSSIMTF